MRRSEFQQSYQSDLDAEASGFKVKLKNGSWAVQKSAIF